MSVVFSCCRRSNVASFGETFQGRPCEAMLDSCLCRGVADRQGEQKRPVIWDQTCELWEVFAVF